MWSYLSHISVFFSCLGPNPFPPKQFLMSNPRQYFLSCSLTPSVFKSVLHTARIIKKKHKSILGRLMRMYRMHITIYISILFPCNKPLRWADLVHVVLVFIMCLFPVEQMNFGSTNGYLLSRCFCMIYL